MARRAQYAVVAAIVAAASAVVAVAPAGAVDYAFNCTIAPPILGQAATTVNATYTASGPTEVEQGANFTVTLERVTAPPVDTVLASSSLTISATNATSVDGLTRTATGPIALTGGVPTTTTNTFEFTATGAVGSTISLFHDTQANVVDSVLGIDLVPDSTVTCPGTGVAWFTTQIVAAPGADAPNAIADVAEVGAGGSVTINVLANDEPNDDWATDPSTLAIVTPPAHGTATIDPGELGTAAVGDITYTPDAGFTGTDSFQYRVCSEALSADDVRCDTATVTVTVNAAATTTTTTTPAPSTTAPAGGELPRTGGGRSTVPLGAFGLGALVAGLAVLAVRTRRLRFER